MLGKTPEVMEDNNFWEATADMYNQLFTRAPMTKRLLLRPPFRYIFDILAKTIQITQFGDAIFTQDELDIRFYNVINLQSLLFLIYCIYIYIIIIL